MKPWSSEEIDNIAFPASEHYKSVAQATDHIREMQEAVEELRRETFFYAFQKKIAEFFWPAPNQEDDGAYSGGTWPCQGDNW